SIATSLHALSAMPATSLVSWPLKKAIAPVALERAHFSSDPRFAHFVFARPAVEALHANTWFESRSLHPLGRTPLERHFPYEGKPSSWLRHSGARHFFACPTDQSQHAC